MLSDLKATDILEIIQFFHQDNPIIRSKAFICKDNNQKIIGENMPEQEEWLDGICTYTGPGADLPAGGYSKIPGWYPEKIAKSWTVIDVNSDEGDVAEKKTKELVKGDLIIGVTLNPKTLAAIASSYGRDFYKIKDANDVEMTLDEWQAKYESNGLGLVAIRNMRRKINGGGVQIG